MKLSVKNLVLQTAVISACISAQNLGAQQLSLGVLRENSLLPMLESINGVEFVGRMPISTFMSVQLRVDRGGASYHKPSPDTIIAFTGFNTTPLRFPDSMDTFGAALSLPVTIANFSPISVSVAPGFRVTRMHYSEYSIRLPDIESWRTYTGPQLGASVTFRPEQFPVGLTFGGDWARNSGNRVVETRTGQSNPRTVTSKRLSMGLTWSGSR